MSFSDSQVKAEKAGIRRRNVSVGDSLFLVIEPSVMTEKVVESPLKDG